MEYPQFRAIHNMASLCFALCVITMDLLECEMAGKKIQISRCCFNVSAVCKNVNKYLQ